YLVALLLTGGGGGVGLLAGRGPPGARGRGGGGAGGARGGVGGRRPGAGGGHAVALWAARITPAAWAQVALVTLALGLGHGALGMAVTLARGFWFPRRYGLLHQRLRAWLADRLKALLIGGALSLAAVEIAYGLIALTPYWWLVA